MHTGGNWQHLAAPDGSDKVLLQIFAQLFSEQLFPTSGKLPESSSISIFPFFFNIIQIT